MALVWEGALPASRSRGRMWPLLPAIGVLVLWMGLLWLAERPEGVWLGRTVLTFDLGEAEELSFTSPPQGLSTHRELVLVAFENDQVWEHGGRGILAQEWIFRLGDYAYVCTAYDLRDAVRVE